MKSRAEILKELLPGLNELFGMEYKKNYYRKQIGGNEYVHNVQRETPADSARTEGIEQQTV